MQAHHSDTLRESVISVLGAPPDPCPLQPEVLDVAAGKGFRREHIKFQVSPGDWSYAYLLIPDNLTSAAPVVYAHHRHENKFNLGKSEVVGIAGDKDQAIGLELVKLGYIVFAPDAVGFGERRSPDSDGDTYDLAYSFHQRRDDGTVGGSHGPTYSRRGGSWWRGHLSPAHQARRLVSNRVRGSAPDASCGYAPHLESGRAACVSFISRRQRSRQRRCT